MYMDSFHLGTGLFILVLLCVFAGFLTGGLAALLSAGIEDDRRTPIVRHAFFLPVVVLAAVIGVGIARETLDENVFQRPTSVAPLAGAYVLSIGYDGAGEIAEAISGDRPGVFVLDGDGGEAPGLTLTHSQTVGVDDALGNVTRLQVAGPLIAGAYRIEHGAEHYFVFDTRSGALALIRDAAVFRATAARRGIVPALEDVRDAYAHHRTWLDWIADGLLWGIPALGLLWLIAAPLALRWRVARS
jgi:hypothetical protein